MASIELAKSFFDALSLMDPPSLNKTTTDEAQEAELEIKNAKAAAERERSLPPAKAPYLPRAGLIFAMVRERVEFDEKMARKNAHAFHKTYVGNEKSFCATALSQLRKGTMNLADRYQHHCS